MSHKYFETKNKHKQNRRPRLNFNQYLYNAPETQFGDFQGSQVKIDEMEQEDYYNTKGHIRVWPGA